MHASNIAFLLLAASAAAPALAAPLSARMPAGVPAAADIATRETTSSLDDANVQLLRTLLTSRSNNDGAPLPMSDIDAFKVLFGRGGQGEVPGEVAARSDVDDFITLLKLSSRDVGLSELQPRFSLAGLIASLEGLAGSVLRRDVPEELAARSDVDDFITLLKLSSRDVGLSELQPRFSLAGLIASLEGLAGSVLRRDVPEELAARSDVDDFINFLKLSSRDVGLSELQPRFSLAGLIASLEGLAGSVLRRDVPDELAARSDVDDFITLLKLSSRDVGLSELEPRFSLSGLIASLEGLAGSVIRRDDLD